VITHVTRVACAVKVDAIPAGREVGLSSHSITRLGGETVVVGCVATRGQAYVLYSLLGKARRVKSPRRFNPGVSYEADTWVAHEHSGGWITEELDCQQPYGAQREGRWH
jgi:hypothetical protein